MARSSADSTTMQVALPRDLDQFISEISAKTHVPKSVIIRMGVERIVKEIKEGKVQLGISFTP